MDAIILALSSGDNILFILPLLLLLLFLLYLFLLLPILLFNGIYGTIYLSTKARRTALCTLAFEKNYCSSRVRSLYSAWNGLTCVLSDEQIGYNCSES